MYIQETIVFEWQRANPDLFGYGINPEAWSDYEVPKRNKYVEPVVRKIARDFEFAAEYGEDEIHVAIRRKGETMASLVTIKARVLYQTKLKKGLKV